VARGEGESLVNMSIAENTGGPKRPPVAPNINPYSTVFLPLTVPPRRMSGRLATDQRAKVSEAWRTFLSKEDVDRVTIFLIIRKMEADIYGGGE
jgi:hypothetical protein